MILLLYFQDLLSFLSKQGSLLAPFPPVQSLYPRFFCYLALLLPNHFAWMRAEGHWILLSENIFSNISCREDALQYNFVFNLAIFVKGKQIPGQICYLGARCCCFVAKSCVWLSATLWTVDCQDPLSTRFPRQEYWRELPFPSPGDLPDPGIEPMSLSPAFFSDVTRILFYYFILFLINLFF